MAEAFYVPLLISTGVNLITSLFAPKQKQKAQDPNPRVPKSDYGSPLYKIYGRVRIEGNKFWPDTADKMYRVETTTERSGGKGGGGTETEFKTVYGTFAVLFSQGVVQLERIIVNGKQIETSHNFFAEYCTFFDGTQSSPWSEMVALEDGDYQEIAYKGINYLAVKDLPCESYGNTIPSQISAVLIDDDFGATPTLAEVVGDMCDRAGIDSAIIDITELEDIILTTGLLVQESGEGYRKAIEDLMGFYLFTAIETRDGKIAFKKFARGDATPLLIPVEDYLPSSEGGMNEKYFVKTVEPKSDLPNKIIIKYNNENQNWDSDEIVEYFEDFTKENSISLDLPITSYPYEVKYRARQILRHLFLQQRNTYNFSLPANYLTQLDLLELVILPNNEVVQIHQMNLGADFKLDIIAKYYSGNTNYTYSPSSAENSRQPPILNDPTDSIPDIYILDIPAIDENPPNVLYCCATAPCTVQVSVDNGTSYPNSVYHRAISTIADVLNTLPSATGLDETNYIDIEIESGDVETLTSDQFNSGYGLALVGREVDGYYEGELLKFRDVEVLTSTTRRLTYLARGQQNTSTNHVSGEKFFLLKAPNFAYYSVFNGNSENIGTTISFRPVVANWQNLGTTPVTTVTPAGNAYRPPAPTNLSGTIDPDDNITYSWDYSTLFSPYNNSQESVSYEVDILDSMSAVVRTLTSATKSVVYSLIDRTADGLGTTITIRVYAVSSIVGRGAVAEDEIIPDSVDYANDPLIIEVDATAYPPRSLLKFVSGDNIELEGDSDSESVTVTVNAIVPDDLTLPATVSTNYTIQNSDYKKFIKASGTITITVQSTPTDYFECIIQNVGTGIITISGITNAVGNKLTTQWTACHVYYDGTIWTAVGALTT